MLIGTVPHGVKPENSTLTLTSCTFRNNTAIEGGGAIFNEHATIIATDTTFSDNSGESVGGAVYSDGFSSFSGCEFIGNAAGIGGALESWGVGTTVDHCKFIGNTATADGFGGAIVADAEMTVQTTLFQCNSALIGGAIVFFSDPTSNGKLSMDDVEISASTAEVAGGGLILVGGVADINNCRFRQNTAGVAGGAILRSFAPLAELTLKGTVFQNNNAAEGDDILNDDPTTVECGDGYGNCFCDADNTNDISTNDLPATCAGDGVGPDCKACNPSAAPIVCSGDNGPIGAVAVSTRAEEISPPDMDIVDMVGKMMERITRKHPGQNRRHERAI